MTSKLSQATRIKQFRAYIHVPTLCMRQLFGHTETYNLHGLEHSLECYI